MQTASRVDPYRRLNLIQRHISTPPATSFQSSGKAGYYGPTASNVCGIIAYVGKESVTPFLLEGSRSLSSNVELTIRFEILIPSRNDFNYFFPIMHCPRSVSLNISALLYIHISYLCAGLEILQNRGYDSAGIATIDNGKLFTTKVSFISHLIATISPDMIHSAEMDML